MSTATASTAQTGVSTPQQPQAQQDQDEKRRKEAARRRKDAGTTWEDLGRQLSPQEMKKGATTAKDAFGAVVR